jgi:FMN reductase
VEHIELRTLAVELANHLATRLAGPALRAAFDAVSTADGVIAVTPVFNGSYSGLFKLFFDALDEGAMKGRPVLLGATGGTSRHSLVIEHAMLPLFYYLKAVIGTHPVFAATRDWGTAGGKLDKRIHRAAVAFAQQVVAARPGKGGDDLEVVDFADLLTDE